MQLRDAETSELLLDGDPLEVATVGRELGLDNVLFDGAVGFDPDAVIAADEARRKGLLEVAKDTGLDKLVRQNAKENATRPPLRDVDKLVADARKTRDQARRRVKARRG